MPRSIPRLIFDVVAAVIGTLLIAGFALAYAARYVPPTRLWWVQILGPLLPLFVGLILGALVLTALSRNWPMVWLLVLCLGLFAFRHLSIGFLTTSAAGPAGDPIKVVAFNARLITNVETAEAASMEFSPIEPDFIAMQESPVRAIPDDEGVFMARQVRLMIASTGTELPVVDLTEEGTQLPVLSKAAPTLRMEEIYSRAGVVIATRSEFEHQGRRFVIYNAHLHSFRRDGIITGPDAAGDDTVSAGQTLREDFLIRMDEAVDLKRVLEQETLPYIVCADLNSTPDNWIYRHLSRGLTDAHRRTGRWFGGTFPSPLPIARIDFIFFSPHWVVHDSQALPIIMSDHRPVMASASLRRD